jgi:hypothetical protein
MAIKACCLFLLRTVSSVVQPESGVASVTDKRVFCSINGKKERVEQVVQFLRCEQNEESEDDRVV